MLKPSFATLFAFSGCPIYPRLAQPAVTPRKGSLKTPILPSIRHGSHIFSTQLSTKYVGKVCRPNVKIRLHFANRNPHVRIFFLARIHR